MKNSGEVDSFQDRITSHTAYVQKAKPRTLSFKLGNPTKCKYNLRIYIHWLVVSLLSTIGQLYLN